MRRKIGSPPQVRGKLGFWLSLRAVLRITPAGAGKTLFKLVAAKAVEDHPRRCGENNPRCVHGLSLRGSPPQVRGKRNSRLRSGGAERITPAGAGKTPVTAAVTPLKPDHPRRCGENQSSPNPTHNNIGSPPQVRGKPTGSIITSFTLRITPAGAGKTNLPQTQPTTI